MIAFSQAAGPNCPAALFRDQNSQKILLRTDSPFGPLNYLKAGPIMGAIANQSLHRFFSRTFRPFFLLTGAGTAMVGLYAFLPAWAMPNVAKLPYLQDYTIIIQHWGIMVGLMGVDMMVSAMVPEWRVPILLYSAMEKAFMAWLVLSNTEHSFVSGFWIPFAVDSTVVIYTIGYFLTVGFRIPQPESLGQYP
ncbi:MAG: hypothetical protein K8T89_19580 [Planctomycetes bacterium]|nr:hypothetical protein [Planctomycetota bacterium]